MSDRPTVFGRPFKLVLGRVVVPARSERLAEISEEVGLWNGCCWV